MAITNFRPAIVAKQPMDPLVVSAAESASNRPGDARSLFAGTLAGAAKDIAPLTIGASVVAEDGRVLRIPSSGQPIIVAHRQDFAIEPGEIYAARWAVRRIKDTSDRLGDALEAKLAWLDKNKSLISTVVVDSRSLLVSEGRHAVSCTFSRDQEADFTAPAGARYVRPYWRILGGDGITDVEVLDRWVTNGLPGPKGDTGDVTPAAQAARDESVSASLVSAEHAQEARDAAGTITATTFVNVSDLLADDQLAYDDGSPATLGTDVVRVAVGSILNAGGFRYAVAPSDATAHHVTTAGGLKLYVMLSAEGEILADAWGAVGDGTSVVDSGTDNAVVLQKICDYVANYPPLGRDGKPPVVRFGAGKVYAYSVSPNWATRNWVKVLGKNTTFRNLGTGDALILDAGPFTVTRFNIEFSGILVEGKANSGRGVWGRSIHHSLIDVEVRGCGTDKAGIEFNFAVCTEFRPVVSVNRGPWYDGARPRRGFVLDRRNAGEGTTACYIPNPIIEGVSAQGIWYVDADQCLLKGGTSEANGGTNIEVSADSRHNIFDAVDLEVSGAGNSFIDRGRWNKWRDIYADELCTFTSTSQGCTLSGIANSVTDAGTANTLQDLSYNLNSGVITVTGLAVGTNQQINVTNFATGALISVVNDLRSLRIGGGAGQIRKTVTAQIDLTAFTVPSAVPGPSDKSGIVINGIAVGDIALVDLPGLPRQFSASATITADNTAAIRVTQLYGAPANPFPEGVRARLIFIRT